MGMRTRIPAAVIASARSVMTFEGFGEVRTAAQDWEPGTLLAPAAWPAQSAPDTRKEQG
jgi:hypothetical protein